MLELDTTHYKDDNTPLLPTLVDRADSRFAPSQWETSLLQNQSW